MEDGRWRQKMMLEDKKKKKKDKDEEWRHDIKDERPRWEKKMEDKDERWKWKMKMEDEGGRWSWKIKPTWFYFNLIPISEQKCSSNSLYRLVSF